MRLVITCIIILFVNSVFSQDKIYLLNSEIISCEVLEINSENIIYVRWDNKKGPDSEFTQQKESEKIYCRNTIQLNAFDLIRPNLNLGYEFFIKPHKLSIQANIVVGKNQKNLPFLNFYNNTFRTYLSSFIYLVNKRKINYFTGFTFLYGLGTELSYSRSMNKYFENKYTYYGGYVSNGLKYEFTKNNFVKIFSGIGFVDRNQNGQFIFHVLFDCSVGFQF